MAFEGVEVATMARAIDLYLDEAWGEAAAAHRPAIAFERCETPEEVLSGFERVDCKGHMRKFALRLGNRRYPFMKLLFQELLVRDRFFFAVDTHDQLDLKDSFPDYEAWLEVKRFNAGVKERVEDRWSEAGVPTFALVVQEVEQRARAQGAGGSLEAPRILIVDDDLSIARGVDAILRGRGYRTSVVHTAEAAMEALRQGEAEGELPDLVLSDLEMPGASGFDLATFVRGRPALDGVAFLLATAANVAPEVALAAPLDGFLVKPYDTPILLKFVEETLARRMQAEDAGAGGAVPGTGSPGAGDRPVERRAPEGGAGSPDAPWREAEAADPPASPEPESG